MAADSAFLTQDIAEYDGLGARILVVDDDESNRGVLSRLLQRRNYRVTEMETGAGAIAAVKIDPPDLVLLDLMMPDLSGADTLRAIRQMYDPCQLPVIMVTADHDAESAAQCLAAGANDFVTKPVQWAVLRARIETHLTMRRAHALLRQDRDRLRDAISARSSMIARIDAALAHAEP